MKKEIYFTSGEFSSLCNVPKQTLLFYEKKGLIQPQYINAQNNYRYYSSQQLDQVDNLIILRKLGLSLDSIKEYIQHRDLNRCCQLLQQQHQEVERQIKELSRIKEQIDHKLATLSKAEQFQSQKMTIEYREEIYYIKEEVTNSNDEYTMVNAISDLIKRANEKELYCGYPVGAVVKQESLNKKDYQNIGALIIQIKEKEKEQETYIRPAGLYASALHQGSYYETQRTYDQLIEYIQQRGYFINGDSFEHTIVDGFVVKEEEQYLTEIVIPVLPVTK